MTMTDHGCRDVLLQQWHSIQFPDADPVEITVSTEPPLVMNPFIEGYRCPHGVDYWIEPTSEQHAKWRAEGTP